MESTKKLLIIIPIFLAILISGCTQAGVTTGPGLTIESFKAEGGFKQVESGEQVKLAVKIKNLGEKEAKNVKVSLINIEPTEWQSYDNEKRYTTMLPSDPTYGTPGEEKTIYFDLKAPKLQKGIVQSYTPGVRVYYEYQTDASKKIIVASEDEMRRKAVKGESLESTATSYTAGPLTVDVVAGNVKVKELGRNKVPFTIKIRNSGSGIVSKKVYGGREVDYLINMKMTLPTGLSLTSDAPQECRGSKPLQLFEGRELDLSCEMYVTPSTTVVAQEKTIELSLGYDYYVDSTTKIDVKGTEETRVTPPSSPAY